MLLGVCDQSGASLKPVVCCTHQVLLHGSQPRILHKLTSDTTYNCESRSFKTWFGKFFTDTQILFYCWFSGHQRDDDDDDDDDDHDDHDDHDGGDDDHDFKALKCG